MTSPGMGIPGLPNPGAGDTRDIVDYLGNGLVSTVAGWIVDGVEFVDRLIRDIVDVFTGIPTVVHAMVQGIKDWFHGLWQTGRGGAAEQQQSQLVDQQGKLILTKEQAEAAQVAAAAAAAAAAISEGLAIAADERIDDLANITATKVDFADIPTDVPGWYSLNPVEDVNFPRSELVKIPRILNGITGTGPNTNGHTHPVTLEWVDPTFVPADSRICFVYINATRRRIYNTVGFAVGQKPPGAAAWLSVSIYKMDADANGVRNGNLTLVRTLGNIATDLPTLGDVRVEFADLPAEPGDWFAVAMTQFAGDGRPLYCKDAAGLPPSNGVNPSKLVMTHNSTVLAPAFSKTSLDTTSTIVPWVALGQKTAIAPESWADLFDRDTANTLGLNWSTSGIGFVIRPGVPHSNGVVHSKQIDYGWNKSQENYSTAAYVKPTATRSQSTSIKIDAWPNYDIIDAIRNKPYSTTAWSRGNVNLTYGVAMIIYPKRVEIRGFNKDFPRNTTDPAFLGGKLLIEENHLEGTGSATWYLHATGVGGTYTLYKNGETPAHAVKTWSDSETAPQYAVNRGDKYGGITVYCFSRGDLNSNWRGQYISAPIDEWKLRDLTT